MIPYETRIKALRAECEICLDFDRVHHELDALQIEIATTEDLDPLKKVRFGNFIETMKSVLAERQKSAAHLIPALAKANQQLTTLSDEDGTGLIAWFFKVINAGSELTPEMEGFVRPLMVRFQHDAGKNKQRISKDFSKYSLLAEIGPNPERSERNLRTLRVALRLSITPPGFYEEMIPRCDAAINIALKRQALSQQELLKESFDRCKTEVDTKWQERERGKEAFLDQGISNAIHISLYGIADAIAQTEDAVINGAAFANELNDVLGQFAAVRFPSSTTILMRFKDEINEARQELECGNDFHRLREWLADIRNRIKAAQRGRWGIDRMHPNHVTAALAEANETFDSIAAKEVNPSALDAELRFLEDQVRGAEAQHEPVSAGLIKRLGQRVKRDSPLVNWVITFSRRRPEEAAQFEVRLGEIRDSLGRLWKRMEAEEEKRVAIFMRDCDELQERIAATLDLREILREVLQFKQAVDDFSGPQKRALYARTEILFSAFENRACDTDALTTAIQSLHAKIDTCHRRIYSPIDFDDLNDDAVNIARWVNLKVFPSRFKRDFLRGVDDLFNELRKLKFRQERMHREREAKADQLATEFEEEIEEGVVAALASPGKPEFWQSLVDLDHRLKHNWKFLGDEKGKVLMDRLSTGFEKIRSARTQFAIEAARVFNEYNEALSDTLFTLEQEGTKDAARAAIDRIKPLRATLRAETRLLGHHRYELITLLNNVSSAIDEVFEETKKAASQEFSRIKLEIERLRQIVAGVRDWNSANALIAAHKALSAKIRETDLGIAARRDLRSEMEDVWESISERLDALRNSRSRDERADDAVKRLERQGYLMIVTEIPTIA